MEVDGVAAIVTGGGSGLGAGTGRALAAAGAKVAFLDLDLARASEVAGETGGLAIACDVTNAAQAESALAQAAERHGQARILVNCAGIAPASRIVGRAGPMALDAFAKVVGINLVGTFNMIRLMAASASSLEALEGGERGVIISTASVAAFEGQIGQSAYAASKAGVVGLTLPAARELGPVGIRVCAIAPGLFETPLLRSLPEEVQASLGTSVPFPSRLGRPDEYAALVMAIVRNSMLNGEVIRLDGALRMASR